MTTTPSVPAGAIDVGEWSPSGKWRRFWGTSWLVETKYGDDVWLEIGGEQFRDGRIDRDIRVRGADLVLYADEARAVAANLLEAADELDALGSGVGSRF